jgi:hypothetical protein
LLAPALSTVLLLLLPLSQWRWWGSCRRWHALQKQKRARDSWMLRLMLQHQKQMLQWMMLQQVVWLLVQKHLLLQHLWQLQPRERGGEETARKSRSRKCLQQQQQQAKQQRMRIKSTRRRSSYLRPPQRLQVWNKQPSARSSVEGTMHSSSSSRRRRQRHMRHSSRKQQLLEKLMTLAAMQQQQQQLWRKQRQEQQALLLEQLQVL